MNSVIYALSDPRDGQIRYIGKANDAARRLKSHIRESQILVRPVCRWVKSLIDIGLCPVMTILRIVPRNEWESAEREMIAQYRVTHDLLNLADGGSLPKANREQLAQNGRKAAIKRVRTPFDAKVWRLKLKMGQYLKRARDDGLEETEHYKSIVAKLKYAAAKRPELFGLWASL